MADNLPDLRSILLELQAHLPGIEIPLNDFDALQWGSSTSPRQEGADLSSALEAIVGAFVRVDELNKRTLAWFGNAPRDERETHSESQKSRWNVGCKAWATLKQWKEFLENLSSIESDQKQSQQGQPAISPVGIMATFPPNLLDLERQLFLKHGALGFQLINYNFIRRVMDESNNKYDHKIYKIPLREATKALRWSGRKCSDRLEEASGRVKYARENNQSEYAIQAEEEALSLWQTAHSAVWDWHKLIRYQSRMEYERKEIWKTLEELLRIP